MILRPTALCALVLAAQATMLFALPTLAATAVDSALVNPLTFRIEPTHPCPGDSVFVTADLCAPCGQFISATRTNTGGARFEVFTRVGAVCPAQPCPSASRSVRLGFFPTGSHLVGVTTVVRTVYPDSTTHTTELRSTVNVDVADVCPPPGPVPFPVRLSIVAPAACDTCPAQLCPGDPLVVRIQGEFPNGCYRITGLHPLPVGAPIDPPIVIMEVSEIVGPPCTLATVSFDTTVTLSAQPVGLHVLRLNVEQRRVSPDSVLAETTWERHLGFHVRESCWPPYACVWPWLTVPNSTLTQCVTQITKGGVATLPFSVETPVALAGLEGVITPQAPLWIASLSTGAGAVGMRLEWTRTAEGVRWVLFADRARIAANSPLPILRVGLSLAPDAVAPDRMAVLGTITGASDSVGGKVEVCNVSTFARYAGHFVCLANGCDVNGDGIANVRDLVHMVVCMRDSTLCVGRLVIPDCDSDGEFDLDDVMCCARQVLHGGARDSSVSRPAPGLAVSFGIPRATIGGIDLPFSLIGLGNLGSARILLRYPSDRFEWDAARYEGDADGWLALAEEITPGVIALGAIQLGGQASELPWTLALRLRPGATSQGEVTVESGEFAATDGVTLTSPVAGATSPRLGGPEGAPRLALGAARPNPTTGEARFAVELAFDSGVELTVHDLSGRHVATLFEGSMSAGTRDFLWRGTDETGRSSPDGVYFVRLKVDGQVRSQRVTVLRSR